MKCFLLAAGYGSRLAPLTDTTPKCLIPINNLPLINYWEQLFIKYNINNVIINTHYLSNKVKQYINNKPIFHESYEKDLLGSAGTIMHNKSFITSDEPFFICYADNLTNINLNDMLKYHTSKNALLTMALYESPNPKECGIVNINNNNKIISFEEKPPCPTSNLANGGIYITDRRIFNYLENKKDFGKDVLPFLPNTYGYKDNYYLLDIGTLKNYHMAEEDVKSGLYTIDY